VPVRLGQEIQEVLRRRRLILLLALAAAACQPRPAEPPAQGADGSLNLPAPPSAHDLLLRDEAERRRADRDRDLVHKQTRDLQP
jgi:hypothetical protein